MKRVSNTHRNTHCCFSLVNCSVKWQFPQMIRSHDIVSALDSHSRCMKFLSIFNWPNSSLAFAVFVVIDDFSTIQCKPKHTRKWMKTLLLRISSQCYSARVLVWQSLSPEFTMYALPNLRESCVIHNCSIPQNVSRWCDWLLLIFYLCLLICCDAHLDVAVHLTKTRQTWIENNEQTETKLDSAVMWFQMLCSCLCVRVNVYSSWQASSYFAVVYWIVARRQVPCNTTATTLMVGIVSDVRARLCLCVWKVCIFWNDVWIHWPCVWYR